MTKKEAGRGLLISNVDVLARDFCNHPDHDGGRDYVHECSLGGSAA
jgi:hypothetical protein